MKRREFITAAACISVAWPRIEAAERTYHVALIYSDGPVSNMTEAMNPYVRALLHGLRELGYVEGQNLVFERRSAEGKGVKRAGEIGAEFIRDGIDVIVVASTLVAKELTGLTKTVPIVMATSVDPIARGVVTSLARPGGNVTILVAPIVTYARRAAVASV